MPINKRIRFFFRLSFAFFKKRIGLIILGIFAGVLGYLLISKVIKYLPSPRKTEKIGISGKYTIEDIPEEILNKISFGLTEILDDGKVVTKLCDRWDISTDEKIYSFFFGNKKYFWHDGTEFNVNDINYNFRDAKILHIDSYLVKILLSEPFSPLLSVLSQPIFKNGLNGLGDYRVGKIESSGQILKTIYLKPKSELKSLPNVIYKFYVNESYLKTAFKLGEINKINEISSIVGLENINNLFIKTIQPADRYIALFFNSKKDPFVEKNFRQAIAYSLNKSGAKKRAFSPINPSSFVFNPGVKKYEKDISKTKLLLSKIKIEPDRIYSIYTFPSLEGEAKSIQEDLAKIGLKCEVKFSSFPPADYDMFLAVEKIPSDPDQYQYWHTDQKRNISNFSNPRIDKLLEDGRKVFDPDERKKIYFDFQRFLVEESPAVFLYFPIYYSVEKK